MPDKTRSELTSRITRPHDPPEPPVVVYRHARTVRSRQGFASPRQNQARPGRLRAVPAAREYATGGSGGITRQDGRFAAKRPGSY